MGWSDVYAALLLPSLVAQQAVPILKQLLEITPSKMGELFSVPKLELMTLLEVLDFSRRHENDFHVTAAADGLLILPL